VLPLISYLPVHSNLRASLQNDCCGCKTLLRLEQAFCDRRTQSDNALGQRSVAQVMLGNIDVASLLGVSWSSGNTRQPVLWGREQSLSLFTSVDTAVVPMQPC